MVIFEIVKIGISVTVGDIFKFLTISYCIGKSIYDRDFRKFIFEILNDYISITTKDLT